jgi:hypothetical protein
MKKYFTFLDEKYPVECVYSGNSESLMTTKYECVFFVAQRNNLPLEGFSNPVFT